MNTENKNILYFEILRVHIKHSKCLVLYFIMISVTTFLVIYSHKMVFFNKIYAKINCQDLKIAK